MVKYKLKKHEVTPKTLAFTPIVSEVNIKDNTIRNARTKLVNYRVTSTMFNETFNIDEPHKIITDIGEAHFREFLTKLNIFTKEDIRSRNGRIMFREGNHLPFRIKSDYMYEIDIELDLTQPSIPNDTFDGYEGVSREWVPNLEIKLKSVY
jgi:hypothetical protein